MTAPGLKPHNSYADLAPYFDVHEKTVARWARDGRFGVVLKVANTVRISRRAVEDFEAAHAYDLCALSGVRASAPALDELAPRSTANALNPNRRGEAERGVGPLRAAALRRSA